MSNTKVVLLNTCQQPPGTLVADNKTQISDGFREAWEGDKSHVSTVGSRAHPGKKKIEKLSRLGSVLSAERCLVQTRSKTFSPP